MPSCPGLGLSEHREERERLPSRRVVISHWLSRWRRSSLGKRSARLPRLTAMSLRARSMSPSLMEAGARLRRNDRGAEHSLRMGGVPTDRKSGSVDFKQLDITPTGNAENVADAERADVEGADGVYRDPLMVEMFLIAFNIECLRDDLEIVLQQVKLKAFAFKSVVGDKAIGHGLDPEGRLFSELAPESGFHHLAKFQLSTRKPSHRVGMIAALHQDVIVQDHQRAHRHPDSDPRRDLLPEPLFDLARIISGGRHR